MQQQKIWENLGVGEKVLVLAEKKKKKKKTAAEKFYKETVHNISYFNKKTMFTIGNNIQ